MGHSPDDEENEGAELLDRWKSGDEMAAQEIFDQYLMRLTALARTRLSPKMARRVDPEDIVQSAYRSFFRGAADDRYTLEKSGDLWRLLAAIVMNKLHGQVEFHSAQKRSIKVEESMMSGGKDDNSRPMINPEAFVKAPSVTELLGMTEELEQVMTQLPELQRRILELALQGHDTSEIAVETDRSDRTVRRGLETARELLTDRFHKSIEPEV
jgi:RNA polymerase sigma-70 factor (ECF subfamily)